jgi:lactocepin
MRKKKKLKKSLAMSLPILLTVSNMAYAAPTSTSNEVNYDVAQAVSNEESINAVETQEQPFQDNENVRVIVELADQAAIEYATKQGVQYSDLSEATQASLEKKALSAQAAVKQNIAKNKIKMSYENSFTTVFNGFSGEVQFGDVESIKALPNVKDVYLANEYDRPEIEPNMTTSHEFIQSYQAWNTGKFKGEGTVVAVIDSGIDPSHRDMILSSATDEDLTQAEVNTLKSEQGLLGKFYTEKVPYGYNYFDRSLEIRDLVPGGSNHGMHVGGTVAANGDPENGGVKGVAPEAQLLAMKVFSNDPAYASTFSDIYLVAIDEAIKLGADVLNMSLGSVASFYEPNDPANLAITRAVDNGIVASVSAGNSRHIGRGYKTPYAQNPDIGVVGAPGLSYDSIQVAASGNKQTWYNYNLFLNGTEVKGNDGHFGYASDDWVAKLGNKEFDFVSLIGKAGGPADYAGVDVTGKVVAVTRGGTPGPFIDKAAEAARQGAAGIIVQDAGAVGAILYRDLGGFAIPIIFVTKPAGDHLDTLYKEGKTKFSFTMQSSEPAPQAARPTEFSSWGTTPSLDIKPEIMAPGGNIFSTLNNNQYGLMSGTSMAAPHVAGGSAIVMQYIKQHEIYKNWSLAEQTRLAKVLLMNTAKQETGTNNYAFSPRLQGAGQMQIFNATQTPVRVVNPVTNQAKVELRDFTSKVVNFKVKAINDSSEAVTYNVNVDVMTDAIQKGTTGPDTNWTAGVTPSADNPHLRGSEALKDVVVTAPATVTVPAGGSIEIPVSFDLTNAKIPGYLADGKTKTDLPLVEDIFVEGFVRLQDAAGEKVNLAVPFVGFYGKWDRPSILDSFRYIDTKPAYFTEASGGLPHAGFVDNRGTYIGNDPVNGYANALSKFSVSPNGDGLYETIVPVMTFIRGAENLQYNVLDANGKKIRTIRTETFQRKHYYASNQTAASRYTYSTTRAWDGKVNGKVVPDGQYYYEIKARVDLNHREAEWQSKLIPVKVDTTKPVVSAKFNKTTKQLTWEATDGAGIGISHFHVRINGVSTLPANQLYLPNARALDLTSFNVPEGAKIEVVAYDYSNNTTVQEASTKTSTEVNAPIITLESPTPGNGSILKTTSFTVKGYATDDTAVTAIYVNGQSVPVTKTTVSGQDRYGFTTNVTVSGEGVHDIIVKAVDESENEMQISRRPVFVDTTPAKLTVVAPQMVGADADTAELAISVKDNYDSIRVYVNDQEVKFNSGPSSWVKPVAYEEIFTHEVGLEEGNNTFAVSVVDLAGFTTTQTVNVYKAAEGENQGRLVQGNLPLGNITFSLYSEGPNQVWYDFTTDANGYFTHNLPDGNYRIEGVWVDPVWYPLNNSFTITNGLVNGNALVVDALGYKLPEASYNVKGKLLSGFDGVGHTVFSIHTLDGNTWYDARTTGTGEFGFNLPDGTYQVDGIWIAAQNKWHVLNQQFTVKNGVLVGSTELQINIGYANATPGNVTGTLTKGNEALGNIVFSIRTTNGEVVWYDTQADANGNFTFNLPDGSYMVEGIWVGSEGTWYELKQEFTVSGGHQLDINL